MRVFGYIRISRNEEDTGSMSLAAQRKRVLDYASFRNLDVVDVVVDEGVSGSVPLSLRPNGKVLWGRLERGDAEGIVALKLDRMFRSLEDAVVTIRRLKELGKAIHFVDFGGSEFDTESAAGRLLFNLFASFAEYERERIAERTREAKQARRELGLTHSRRRYGYVHVDGKIVPFPPEQLALRYMAQARSRGWSFQRIADELNRIGVPSKTDKPWNQRSVNYLIKRVSENER